MTSLVVQWLRFHTSTAGAWVQSLVRELRSYIPHATRYSHKRKKKKRERENGIIENVLHHRIRIGPAKLPTMFNS